MTPQTDLLLVMPFILKLSTQTLVFWVSISQSRPLHSIQIGEQHSNYFLNLNFKFFLNIIFNRPGCGTDASGACAHERSNLFYSESIRSNRFVGRRCTGYSQIVNRNCPGSGTGIMGGDASKGINGVFFVQTNAASPFARG
jgi:hypothetical protein